MSTGILRTRLVPPRLPEACITREALVAEVRGGLRGRLVAVIAGAGYGKTTLLAQALAAVDWPWVWCSCDARLAGGRALVAHLAEGLRARYPGFGARLAGAAPADEQVEALCDELLDMVAEDVVIALDDVHLLPDEARRAVSLLAEAAAPNVHLAVAGRAPLPLPVRRTDRVELGEAALAFGAPEAAALLAALGRPLVDHELIALHARTEGWAAGLVMAAQGAGDGPAAAAGRLEYLAEEVLARQTTAVREFLRATSVLGRFSPELAAAVSGREDAAAILAHLVSRHLFTVRLGGDGEWYRYHHLLRELLQSELGPERAAPLHRRAAAWWLARDDPVEAVPHLLAAGDLSGAVRVLEPVAEGLALGPQAESVAAWLGAIPRELWARAPGLVLADATLLLGTGEHEASFAQLERAIGALVGEGEHDRAAAALVRLQQAMLGAGTSPSARAAAGERWRERIACDAALLPAARILLASAYGYSGRFREAEAELDAALGLPGARDASAIALAAGVVRAFYVDFWRDDPLAALAALEAAGAALATIPDEDTLAFGLFAQMLRTYLLNELGRFENSIAVAESLLEDARRRGVGRLFVRSATWVRYIQQIGLGRWDELARDFVAPPEIPDLDHPTSYSHRYRAAAARLAGHRGDAVEVAAQVAAARAEMRVFGPAFDDATFLADFALAAMDAGLADLAERQVADARAAAAWVDSPWQRARTALVAARCLAGDAADAALADALGETARHRLDDLWTGRERLLAPSLLVRALGLGLGPQGVAARLLVACGAGGIGRALAAASDAGPGVRAQLAELAGSAADVDIGLLDRLMRDREGGVREAARRSWRLLKARPRAAVRIETLGDLRVLRDDVPVPPGAFVRSKARALLAALLVAEGPVHRERLGGWLWPELSADRAAASLRTTLHDLRRAVEPELDAGSPASLVQTDGDMVRLALTERDGWDVADLRRLAHGPAGEDIATRLGRLRAAEALCGGTFLPEWPYDDWAEPMRAQLEEEQAQVISALAAALQDAGAPQEAIARWKRLVVREPVREAWHRGLMEAYAAAGEPALALRQYHACRTVLRRELGVEPTEATRARYLALLRATPEAVSPPV